MKSLDTIALTLGLVLMSPAAVLAASDQAKGATAATPAATAADMTEGEVRRPAR